MYADSRKLSFSKMRLILGVTSVLLNICVQKVSSIDPSSKYVDLTWPLDNTTIYWPDSIPFTFTRKIANMTEKNYWYASNEFSAGEHGGTHLDAPYHFNKEGRKVGDIPIQDLITTGVVVDICDEVQKIGASARLKKQHLTNWVNENGPLKNNTVVLIKFGWSKHWPNKSAYLGLIKNGNEYQLDFPGISAEAAQWLADNDKIIGVGVDVASVDPGDSTTFDVHIILSKKEKYLIENVKLVESLPVKDFTLLVMPMKIAAGTGAPLRLIAIVKK